MDKKAVILCSIFSVLLIGIIGIGVSSIKVDRKIAEQKRIEEQRIIDKIRGEKRIESAKIAAELRKVEQKRFRIEEKKRVKIAEQKNKEKKEKLENERISRIIAANELADRNKFERIERERREKRRIEKAEANRVSYKEVKVYQNSDHLSDAVVSNILNKSNTFRSGSFIEKTRMGNEYNYNYEVIYITGNGSIRVGTLDVNIINNRCIEVYFNGTPLWMTGLYELAGYRNP